MMDTPVVRDLREWLRFGRGSHEIEHLISRSVKEIERLEAVNKTVRQDTLEEAARIADESPFDIGIAPKIRKLKAK